MTIDQPGSDKSAVLAKLFRVDWGVAQKSQHGRQSDVYVLWIFQHGNRETQKPASGLFLYFRCYLLN